MATKLTVLIATIFLLVGCAAGKGPGPMQASPRMPEPEDRVPGEYIITLRPQAGAETIDAVYGFFGITRLQDLGGGKYLIRLSQDPGLETVRSTGHASGQVEAAQPNFVYRLDRLDIRKPDS